ncbi:chorismate-binding protein [Massilia sp. H-1]|nr:chorismate-binding protein [Massilia sp. H-1]
MPACPPAQCAARALAQLRATGDNADVIMGALPFADHAPQRLFIPAQVSTHIRDADMGPAETPPRHRKAHPVRMRPSPDTYRANVEQALACIRATGLDKVVLSRSLSVDVRLDLAALLRRLAARNPIGYTFAIDLAGRQAPRRTLIGASPELLLSRRGTQVLSHPLAGSIPAQQRSGRRPAPRRRPAALGQGSARACAGGQRRGRRPASVLQGPVGAAAAVAAVDADHVAPGDRSEGRTGRSGRLVAGTGAGAASPRRPCAAIRARRRTTSSAAPKASNAATSPDWWAGATRKHDGEWAVTLRCADVGENDATLYAGA